MGAGHGAREATRLVSGARWIQYRVGGVWARLWWARDALGALSGALDAVTTSQTVVGTRLAWIDFVTTRHEDLGELRATEEADLGGTDIASTVARLQEALVVLEASQASFAKLAGLSLFNSLN